MAQKTLNAFVVLSGRVDNTFGQIGTELINLGYQVDEVSSHLVNFGKKSLQVYSDYQYNMQMLGGVWGTNGTFAKDSKELKDALDGMEIAVSEWAANSIFHTNDISNALVEAARSGWSYEQMLDGIPSAMAMAQASGMDLSTALNYVLKAQKDFGWEFDDIGMRMDQWIYAANRSAGTAEEFGETFLKLGSVVRFAENTEELFALTKVMHDLGSTGSAAGTLIRSSLMRLYAPSGKANEVLEELGASAEEIKEAGIMEDQGLIEALGTLEKYGFSAFDDVTGQAKPVLQTYGELGKALIAISGYTQESGESMAQFYERVVKNKTVMSILSEVFGIRGVQGSMNLLMSLEEANQIYDELTGKAADGATDYVQSMMNGTLYGSTELLKSKVEELERLVGQDLADDWQKVQSFVGGVIDSINGMDGETFSALVDGLKTVAASGATLVASGSLLRFIGMLRSVPMLFALGSLAAISITSFNQSMRESDFSNMFGDMHLDSGGLSEYILSLGDSFNSAYERVSFFANALDTAVTNYNTASQTFSSDLLNLVLTKKELTPEDVESLQKMGDNIYKEVIAGITASSDKTTEFLNLLYGGDEVAAADPRFQDLLKLVRTGHDSLIEQAQGIAERLREALIKPFGESFTDEDYDTILGLFKEYNTLVTRAQNEAMTEEQFVQQEIWKHKAQTASLDEVQELAGTVTAQRDAQQAELEEQYLYTRAQMKYYAIQSGMTNEEAEQYVIDQGVDEQYRQTRDKFAANYDDFLLTLWQTQIMQSDNRDAYLSLGKYADAYMAGWPLETIMNQITEEMGGSAYSGTGADTTNTRATLGRMMGLMVASMGGVQAVQDRAATLEAAGETELAERLKTMLAMEQLVNGFSDVMQIERPAFDILKLGTNFATSAMGNDVGDGAERERVRKRNMETMYELLGLGKYATSESENTLSPLLQARTQYPEGAAELLGLDGYVGHPTDRSGLVDDFFDTVGSLVTGEVDTETVTNALLNMGEVAGNTLIWLGNEIASKYDLDKVYNDMVARDTEGNLPAAGGMLGNYPAIYDLMYGEASKNTAQYEITEPEEAAIAANNAAQAVLNQRPLYQHIIITSRLEGKNWGGLGGSGGGAGLGVESLENVTMNARGGRQTEPSIFAEAGIPEWYIPEEHTDNTARLILGAMYNSGFDLFEIAEMAGARMFAEGGTSGTAVLTWPTLSSGSTGSSGDSGGDSGSSIQVQYSPVIHSDNAAGLERVLQADKKRFQKWMEEWWAKRQLYESLVAYE